MSRREQCARCGHWSGWCERCGRKDQCLGAAVGDKMYCHYSFGDQRTCFELAVSEFPSPESSQRFLLNQADIGPVS